ncbi:MAG: right-handed parallel beta-helix repeat-containing protein [Planctomycetes bacterium]|nr:right-handed parallel beta-helix repeat-containing protein [Planctomycetota bacterium]
MLGGGIAVFDSDDVVIAMNDFHSNRATRSGGGIYADRSTVTIYKNWIHGNGFESTAVDTEVTSCDFPPTGGPALTARGGGIAITNSFDEICGFPSGSVAANICRNRIYDNDGKQGAGVYCSVGGSTEGSTLVLEFNEIKGNAAFETVPPSESRFPYQGAGICVRGLYTLTGGGGIDPTEPHHFDLLSITNNVVHLNDISVFDATSAYVDPDPLTTAEPSEVGGGLYLFLRTVDGWADDIVVFGNAFTANRAKEKGAGAYFGTYTGAVAQNPAQLHHNSFVGNLLDDDSTGLGAGIYFPWGGDLFGYSYHEGNGNIMEFNDPETAANPEWYVGIEPGVAPPSPAWVYSHLQDHMPAEGDLFGAECSAADPGVESATEAHLKVDAVARNSSDPGLLSLSSDRDIDYHLRPALGSNRDRGADEYLITFFRGDADGSGLFNALLDAIFILNYGFNGGDPPPCQDAADSDNDGVLNYLLDAIYVLNYQYASGPAPPAPGPVDCGPEPFEDPADTLPECPVPTCP